MSFNFIDKLVHFVDELKKSRSIRHKVRKGTGSRDQMLKNFLKKPDRSSGNTDDLITRKTQSMENSQGTNDFSGSAYNGPGNVDHEKRNSNMSQRNF